MTQHLWTELEQLSAASSSSTTLSVPISGIGSRHMSSGEIKYLEPLVKKFGADVHAMSQDRKLNPEQRTVGQLRRALRKSGLGAEVLTWWYVVSDVSLIEIVSKCSSEVNEDHMLPGQWWDSVWVEINELLIKFPVMVFRFQIFLDWV